MNIGFKEDLKTEFKSDVKKLSDDIIIETVVALSNTEGGHLYLGIEDDGKITGIHESHRDITQLAAFIANRTIPPVTVRAELINAEDKRYVDIEVPKSRSIIAASNGKVLRRRIQVDGTPESIPMYPHELNTRLSNLGLLDYSALPVPDSDYKDLDDSERYRLRNIIRRYSGESSLLELDDEELDKALVLAREVDGRLMPTFCGMLLIGKADRIKTLIPTAEAAFQVLKGTRVLMNESFHMPMLAVFEKMEAYMDARNTEAEIEDGLFRISVPDFSKSAFREALVNAFCHRDYTMLGVVRVLLDDDGLTISNPGGFIEGVTAENLLTVEPRGRNPVLADALKRIGLAERTGRGIDRIFEGSLRYGKPIPDYSESTSTTVKLFIPRGLPDKAFVKMISDEQGKTGTSMPINSLLVLNELKRNRRMSFKELCEDTHVSEVKLRNTVEKLVESGMIEPTGSGRGRSYILSSSVYKQSKNTVGYVRQTNIDKIRYPEMIIKFAKSNDNRVTRADVMELCRINDNQAYRVLTKLVRENKLKLCGKGKYAYYEVVK